jgi:WD40 repeat protein/V8-like Glu-specific endopeptidase
MSSWRQVGLLLVTLAVGVSIGFALRSEIVPVASRVLSLFGIGTERVEGTLAFPLSEFRNPVPGTPQGVLATAESAASPNFLRVLNLPGESIRRPARGVGQLRIHLRGEKSFSTCTAFLIDPEHLLTAAHCLAGSESDKALRQMQSENRALASIEELTVHFSYLDTEKQYQGIALEVETKPSEYDPVWSLKMDYVVLKLKAGEAARAKQAGYELEILTLGDVPLKPKQGFYILHYPKGDPLTLTRNYCKAVDKDPPTLENPYEFGHSCDTVPGSSGAPIFSEEHDAVIGIHVCCAYVSKDRFSDSCVQCNIGISFAEIGKHSPTIAKLIKTKLLTRREKLLVARADILAEQSNQQFAKQEYGLAGRLALAGLKPLVEPTAETQADPAKRALQLKDAEDRLLPAAASAEDALKRAIIENRQLVVLRGHEKFVTSAAFSPDGKLIVTGSWDKTARIWDARSGAELKVLRGHEDWIRSAAFSPDGTRIVTGSYDNTARIWDARSGAELKVLRGHESIVYSVAFSPDGTRIVTAGGTARLWDARSGAELKVLRGDEGAVRSAAFSPDGTRIVTGGGAVEGNAVGNSDNTVRIWDARSGAELKVLRGHEYGVNSVAFSSDGTRIVTGSLDKTARIWDALSGAEIKALRGHENGVTSVTFSTDGTRIVTGSFDNTARIWDARTWAELKVLRGHEDRVTSAAFSPDGTRIVTGSYDNTARIWDARSGAELKVLRGHESDVSSAAFSPDGTHIVTGSLDKTAQIWDARSGAELRLLRGHESYVNSAAFSPDGTRIVTGSYDKTARIWDVRSGAELKVLRGHESVAYSAVFSPDGTRIVTGSGDWTARIWDARSGAELKVLRGHESVVYSAAFSPDGTRIVTGSGDWTARIWDARSGVELKVLRAHEEGIRSAAINSAAFSPDGMRIVTASLDKTARIWDARSGAEFKVLRGHEKPVVSAAFSPDGTRIVTGSGDKTARIWDARGGAELKVLRGHEDTVDTAAFSPDGTRIVTGSVDKTARIWDAPRLPAGAALVDAAARSFGTLSTDECMKYALACSVP